MKKHYKTIIALTLVVIAVATYQSGIITYVTCSLTPGGMPYTTVTYDHMEFKAYRQSEGYFQILTGTYPSYLPQQMQPIADIWIILNHSKPIHLPDITEEQVAVWFEEQKIPGRTPTEFSELGKQNTQYYPFRGNTVFVFSEGKLVNAELSNDGGIRVAASEEGPYVSFRISKQEIVETFGSPNAYECKCEHRSISH